MKKQEDQSLKEQLRKETYLRQRIETTVIAYDKTLKNLVSDMSIEILLNNCHPLYRKDYAYEAKCLGLITSDTYRFEYQTPWKNLRFLN